MNVKVLGDAPAMAMGNLYQTLAGFIDKPRTQDAAKDLFQDLLGLPKDDPPKAQGSDDMFAAMPPASLEWSGGEGSGKDTGGGKDGGHRGGTHDGGGDGGLTGALSLFKAFGHGDLDL